MRMSCLAFLAFVAPMASAQSGGAAPSTGTPHPFSLEIGAFFPNYHEATFGKDLGVYGALGYAFYRKDAVTLMGQIRGAYQSVTQGGGGDEIPPGDLTISSLFVNARYQPLGSRFFGGVGLGVGQASRVDAKDHTGALVALEGGYDLTSRLYVSARYETAGPDTLRGGYVGLGFRF